MMTGSTQTNFDPRPYQDECVQAMLHYTGHAAITSLAVGLGKTKITTDFARAIVKRGGRVLLLAHREELVTTTSAISAAALNGAQNTPDETNPLSVHLSRACQVHV